MAPGSYDVFAAITSDVNTAEQWTELVPIDKRLGVFYPGSGDYPIIVKVVQRWRTDHPAPPPDPSAPPSTGPSQPSAPAGPWFWDITDYILGSDPDPSPMCISDDGWIEKAADKLADEIDERVQAWIDAFKAWLEALEKKVREETAKNLEEFAKILENMPHPEEVETTITVEVGWDKHGPIAKAKWTVKCKDARNGAYFARKFAKLVHPPKEVTP